MGVYSKLIIVPACIGLLAMLSGCSSNPTTELVTPTYILGSLERNPLDTDICMPPCWQNITPGRTTEDELRRVLNSSASVAEECHDFDNTEEGGLRGITCGGITFSFEPGENQLGGIRYRLGVEVTLGQAIEKYGEDSYVNIAMLGIPEVPWTNVSLYYPQYGLILLSRQPNYTFNIQPGMIITEAVYLSPLISVREFFWISSYRGAGLEITENTLMPPY